VLCYAGSKSTFTIKCIDLNKYNLAATMGKEKDSCLKRQTTCLEEAIAKVIEKNKRCLSGKLSMQNAYACAG